jgi:hypothetical protein
MSRQTSEKKAGPDVYVGLLFVSVSALITGCIFLVMELNKYDWVMGP